MAHFVQTLSGDGFLNLDNIDGMQIVESSGNCLIAAERHGRSNTILGQRASHEDALDFIRTLLGDAIHDQRE